MIQQLLILNPLNPNDLSHPASLFHSTKMSAPNAGRQSPDPENAPQQTESTTEGAGSEQAQVGTDTDSKGESENTLDNLESNPKGVLEDAAQEKISKDGRGDIGN
jgi:hypothetical protein